MCIQEGPLIIGPGIKQTGKTGWWVSISTCMAKLWIVDWILHTFPYLDLFMVQKVEQKGPLDSQTVIGDDN